MRPFRTLTLGASPLLSGRWFSRRLMLAFDPQSWLQQSIESGSTSPSRPRANGRLRSLRQGCLRSRPDPDRHRHGVGRGYRIYLIIHESFASKRRLCKTLCKSKTNWAGAKDASNRNKMSLLPARARASPLPFLNSEQGGRYFMPLTHRIGESPLNARTPMP